MNKGIKWLVCTGAWLATCTTVLADTWIAQRAVITGKTSTTTFVQGDATFSDGVYNSKTDLVLVLAGYQPPGWPSESMTFFQPYGAPPQIDTTSMQADFSALAWIGYNQDGPAIGRDLGLHTATPFSSNPDGSYTASWTIAKAFTAYEIYTGDAISLTFARAVDEPAPAQLWLVALPLLWLILRGRAQPLGGVWA